MKKTITKTVEVDLCSNCGEEAGLSYECIACGFCCCWDCKERVMVDRYFAVYFSGSEDGRYCKPCDIKLSESKSDPLHNAYMDIQRLRDELKLWSADFDERRKFAEMRAEKLIRQSRRK